MTDNSEPDLDEIKLFAKQRKIFPRTVKGQFRSLKWFAMLVTLGVYYIVPFVRYDRGPNAPDQAVLIDLMQAKAYWFFIEIWPQEIYILTGILILAALSLFAVTSLFGRVWCGYFCPQTVWTDLFIWTETLVQGDRGARVRLQQGPWTFEKFWKLGVTHLIWLVIAWCTAGSFVLYFNDAPTLVRSFLDFNVSPIVLMFIGGLTLSTYVMAGFAREQVCTYMCPYARFQSAMFDENTLIIGYDTARGDPRGAYKKGQDWTGRGHCIDCSACVQVCPMGIDIRKGLQMECIACGLCIDACDNIMDKVNLPRGLIRYDTDRRMKQSAKGIKEGFRILRPRTFLYMFVIAVVGSVMLYKLVTRPVFELHVLHDRAPVFVQMSDGGIRNGYELKILNKTNDHHVFSVRVEGLSDPVVTVKAAQGATIDHLTVKAGTVGHYHIQVEARAKPDDPRPITIVLSNAEKAVELSTRTMFVTRKDSP